MVVVDDEDVSESESSAQPTADAAPRALTAPASLAEVRAGIDLIDSELVRLLAQRQGLVRAAAAFKSDDRAVRAPDRVAQVVASVRERALGAGLEPAVAEAVWRAMIGAFIEFELTTHAQLASTGNGDTGDPHTRNVHTRNVDAGDLDTGDEGGS